jgi:alkanesulfonate monooxygenase SsuD/methylene tetrahydromethanopterin reductase-like flavin-dependent oxidoreductase (luciferase family)
LRIVIPMLRGEQPTLSGKWYQVHGAMNHPAPLSRIPVMIGGGGERKTLRLVAQYADESNLICGASEIPHKLEVLAEHCVNLGRDRSEITVSYQTSACIAPTHELAVAEFEDYITRQPQAEARRRSSIVGSPDEVAEKYAQLRDTGIDGVTVNAPPNGHVEGRVALLGETLAPLFAR